MNKLYASKLEEDAILPTRKFPTDAGADLYSHDDFTLFKDAQAIVRTGITVKIPEGHVGLLYPKSRSYHLIGAGVIDAGYQGEVLVKLVNTSNGDIWCRKGDAIAQLIIVPCVAGEIVEMPKEEIHTEATARSGTGGIVTQLSLLTEEEAKEFMKK